MNNALLTKFINKHKRTDIPEFRPGDTIRVHVKIKEGDKERLQAFEGTLIARNNTGMGETITVRKVSFSHGVERIFPLHARVIDHIDIIRSVLNVKDVKLSTSGEEFAQVEVVPNFKLLGPKSRFYPAAPGERELYG